MGNMGSHLLAIAILVPVSVVIIVVAVLIALWFNQKDKRKVSAMGIIRPSKSKYS